MTPRHSRPAAAVGYSLRAFGQHAVALISKEMLQREGHFPTHIWDAMLCAIQLCNVLRCFAVRHLKMMMWCQTGIDFNLGPADEPLEPNRVVVARGGLGARWCRSAGRYFRLH